VPPTETGSSIQDRARTGSDVDPQEGMFDKEFADADLEAALEARETIRLKRLDINKRYRQADESARGKLAEFELAVGEVARVGRFRIKKTMSTGREVAFVTEASERLFIKAGES
jgi:hypothetical protein